MMESLLIAFSKDVSGEGACLELCPPSFVEEQQAIVTVVSWR